MCLQLEILNMGTKGFLRFLNYHYERLLNSMHAQSPILSHSIPKGEGDSTEARPNPGRTPGKFGKPTLDDDVLAVKPCRLRSGDDQGGHANSPWLCRGTFPTTFR